MSEKLQKKTGWGSGEKAAAEPLSLFKKLFLSDSKIHFSYVIACHYHSQRVCWWVQEKRDEYPNPPYHFIQMIVHTIHLLRIHGILFSTQPCKGMWVCSSFHVLASLPLTDSFKAYNIYGTQIMCQALGTQLWITIFLAKETRRPLREHTLRWININSLNHPS